MSLGLLMRVVWYDGNLPVSKGDEVEVIRGIRLGADHGFDVQATTLRNITTGATFKSHIEYITIMNPPRALDPVIHGYIKSIESNEQRTILEIDDKLPSIPNKVIRDCKGFLDAQLYERCAGKDYQDVVTNAFAVLEERIRTKTGLDPSYHGTNLIDEAFKPSTGRLVSGVTQNERDSFYFVFRGALGYLRNPASHRILKGDYEIESFEIMCMVDLLLRIIDKASIRE